MTTTTTAPPPTGFWQRNRIWFAVALALVVAVAISAWASSGDGEYDDPLDPQNPGPQGAQALAAVLDGQGVDVSVARDAAALEDATVDADTTVVVTGSDELAPSTTERLLDHAAPGRLVLLDPSRALTDAVADDLGTRTRVEPDGVAAGCPAYDGLRVTVDAAVGWRGGEGCFTTGGVTLLHRTGDDTALFGAGTAVSNDQVLRADNAAVGLRLLGATDRLVWYVPTAEDAASDEAPALTDLIPDWIVPGLWLALAAATALVLWRARRLGALSTEPLPVVVRAVETARSRGRMYHHSNDRGHAAASLRAASRRRLAHGLGLAPGAHPDTVIDAAHRRLGHDRDELQGLLAPDAPPPTDDEALVRLADALARLDDEVIRR
ncbi:DUF4350 domain-containing protein [Nocardioides panacisoli]|uniref:DUF4350 domain-containing protein n=1 Tax=Nocardioides panacisoli TaxID=627624 RepID=UPI001C6255AF|nr:DUF4350 domain-containing protein [Nocardioides panacisoli]QYJ04059.1 DUF4350 domain-containing protein [Nocardioides panacisoli]